MLSEIKEPGPGFDYFLNTPCNDWDVVQYHEFWKKSNFGLDKVSVTRRFNTQLQKIKEQGTEEEKNNAIRLKKQFQHYLFILGQMANPKVLKRDVYWMVTTMERIKSTINTIISSHLPTGSSLNRHSYCRKSNSSPKKIRVPIA
ncbi:hypothetical protein RhiirA4_444016 [Rhizophagus irregularis]|uniref:Uncharacterized protein n=1 Tax=Rhizophagus irregularis TaxID=588596 RepID=A0A2I1GH19_9GLOM|nr:hypothetical protein RhiirA4_444016 [Rhizophagus irregularis]